MTGQPFAVPAALMLVLAVPLVLGVVPRNRFYGMRTRRTLADDAVWYPVNRVAGAALMLASIVYGAVAAGLPYDRMASDGFARWGIHLAAFVVPIAAALGLAAWYAKRR